ncbi:MAG TPA: DUF4214 domain-containing protein, partial [Pyrinomonadaceae bacterium]|nr:DUF4214 domain-containing protein [Pyrinomonadaceae bacterium]
AYTDRLFVGASRTTLLGGYLFKFDLTSDRLHVATSDARLADRVADNADKFDLAESESLLVGRDFGITTDIRTGPDGHLYVVSLSDGAVYEVFPLSVIRFVSETFTVGEGARRAVITVTREGDASAAATVEYATQNELARARGDYTAALGTLRFAPGERTKTFDVLITDDAFVEGTESVALYLSEPKGAGLHATFGYATLVIQDNDATAPAANPIDDAEFFVRQHYADFLNREPDAAGLQFWTGQITLCGSNAACVDQRRTVVSAEFFRSIEFQETGFFAHRLYETSFDRPPRLDEFLRDTQELGRGVVVGQPGWEARLEANRQAFVARWLERPDFKSAYDSLTDAQYVDKLVANAGLMPAQANRDALVAGLTSGTETRASVLRKVADSEQLKRNEFNRAFVLMQYFGYLRREPDEAGYTFWLQKLNNHNGDFQSAEMVRSFLVSGEYRGRFGP